MFWPMKEEESGDASPDADGEEQAWTQTASNHSPAKSPFDSNRFSSLTRLLRVTSWVLRFINNCRRAKADRQTGFLSVNELSISKKTWIKVTQAENFAEEIRCLKSSKQFPRKSSINSLSPFLDDDSILRARGRISKASSIDYGARHPIILSPKSHFTKLVIVDFHHRYNHEGNEHVRNIIQQEYWILRCRSYLRKIIHDCPYCRQRRARPQPPMMADLPEVRLTAHLPPFTNVGIDYFGPYTVRNLRKEQKRYGCLFTCLVTRAVHIELAYSLETDSFIMALRKMIARRGTPKTVYSDNGTNFVGAEKELRDCLRRWNQQKIHDSLLQTGIEWHFSPPEAPHFGGVWERLVQSCKRSLNTVLGKQVLSTESFYK